MMRRVEQLIGAFAATYRVYRRMELPAGSDSEPQELARRLRALGLPVQAYALTEPSSANDLPYPFLAVAPEEGWQLHIPPRVGGYVPEEGLWPERQRLEPGTLLVAEPPLGRTFSPAEGSPPVTELPDLFIFYAATSDEADLARAQLFPELEAQWEQALREGRKIIFLDAVGLIPEETVHAHGSDEEAAFEQALAAVCWETEAIEQGRTPYNADSPAWQAVYRFLAERRTHCVLEALDYGLWKRIVDFDAQRLNLQAFNELVAGYPEDAAQTMIEYLRGFHNLNCVEREQRVAQQIEGLLLGDQGRARPLLWVLRELGHYGILEGLLSHRAPALGIQAKILGSPQSRFIDLLKAPALEMLLFNLGVELSEEELRLLALHHCLKALVLNQIGLSKKDLRSVIEFFAASRIEELGLEEIRALIAELHTPTWVWLRKQGQSILEQLLFLLKDRGLIADMHGGGEDAREGTE